MPATSAVPTGRKPDACGTCPSCVKWNKLVHPDVHFVYPIVKSAKGKKEVCDDYIANWRHLLLNSPYFGLNHWLNEMDAENGQAIIYAKESDEITRKLSLKSSEGGYKVTIVWLPEKLHEVCANKLLKLLEEPPEKTIFLLISEAPEMILPTILSRTQRFNIPKIEEADIAEALQQKYGVQPRDSETIAPPGKRRLHQSIGDHPSERRERTVLQPLCQPDATLLPAQDTGNENNGASSLLPWDANGRRTSWTTASA